MNRADFNDNKKSFPLIQIKNTNNNSLQPFASDCSDNYWCLHDNKYLFSNLESIGFHLGF